MDSASPSPPLTMKYLIGSAFILILFTLGAAGFFMLRSGSAPGKPSVPKGNKMAKALALRVGLSVMVFALIWLSYSMGWIAPTGIPVRR
jgi:Protein of unknown function (DUF2909)